MHDRARRSTWIWVGALLWAATAVTAEPVWQPVGPSPILDGWTGVVDGVVAGPVQAVASHPLDARFLWIGAVNGGVWKTENATDPEPEWTPQTDGQVSLSIGALTLDPFDEQYRTLIAGFGRYSGFGTGGRRGGLLRSTDGGTSWTSLGTDALGGRNITDVVARGATLVVAVDMAEGGDGDRGIYRSADTGVTWQQISQGDGTATGLPGGLTHALAADPSDHQVLYASVVDAEAAGGVNGIYRSEDTGASWTKVSDAAVDALLVSGTTTRTALAAGPSDRVWLIVVHDLRIAAMFRSTNAGSTWSPMELPSVFTIGLHNSNGGAQHTTLLADPQVPDVIYAGGDRIRSTKLGGSTRTGVLFRGDASMPPGSQWVHLTDSRDLGPDGGGTASNTAPAAGSRNLAFDAAGDLIEVDNGGVYRRTSPRDDTGDWSSLNGDLQIAELHDIAWDRVAQIGIAGSHDGGPIEQTATGATTWTMIDRGFGGDVAAVPSTVPGQSFRYTSIEYLRWFRRRTFDASNTLVDQSLEHFPTSTQSHSRTSPMVVNAADPLALVFSNGNSVFESYDGGDSGHRLTLPAGINGAGRAPVAYGAVSQPDLLYLARLARVYARTTAHPTTMTRLDAYPGIRDVVGLTLDPQAPERLFVVDEAAVWYSDDAGDTWFDLTGGLPFFDPGLIRSVLYVDRPTGDDMLLVGTNRGVYRALDGEGFAFWSRFGRALPNAPVFELVYDRQDDLLLAATLGRGGWRIDMPESTTIFADGFDQGSTARWSFTVP